MSKLIFDFTQGDQPTKDVAEIVNTYTEARIVHGHRDFIGNKIQDLLQLHRVNAGFDSVALMNAATEQGKDIESIMFDFLPWCHENGALFMVAGSYMDLLVMITEPLAD